MSINPLIYSGCLKNCINGKEENKNTIKDAGVFNDKIKIDKEKIEKTNIHINVKFDDDMVSTFKKVTEENNILLNKSENINKIDETKYKKLKEVLEDKEKNNKLDDKEKKLYKKITEIKETNIEKKKEIITIPFIDNRDSLSFVPKKKILEEIDSAYGESTEEDNKLLKKKVTEAIRTLDTLANKDNKDKNSIKFNSESEDNLYIFGIKIYEGNLVNHIYNKLFDFDKGKECYQIKMLEKEKNGSKNEIESHKCIENENEIENEIKKSKKFNLVFKKTTNKKASDYVSFLNNLFDKTIETSHNVNNDFYLIGDKDDNNFTLYVDSDAIWDGDSISFKFSPSAINVYTDVLYNCFYDEKCNCTYFFTINFGRYEMGLFASGVNGFLKLANNLLGNKEPENDIEKKRLEIMKNQGLYILEIKEQNDENVREIYNYLNNDTTLNSAYISLKDKIDNFKKNNK